MRATFLNAPREIEVRETEEPKILQPTDAIVELAASCICGSDLWPYRGINEVKKPQRIGHEFVGRVLEVGSAVENFQPGQFVVGPFTMGDNTCPHCRAGFQTACQNLEWHEGCQAERIRVAWADGSLVATPGEPADDAMLASLLTCSDVMGTGWHAAEMANVHPGMTVAVVGDGAVGLCAVLSAREMGAERIIAMSRHESRQAIAKQFGATDIVAERGEDGINKVLELTDGVGADAVLECVGTGDSMSQAIYSCRPGGFVGYVGVPHGIEMPIERMFRKNVGVRGGMAPVRQYLPTLIEKVWQGDINPGLVFDLTLPLAEAAEGYRAMDERRAIKVMLKD